MKKYEQVKIFSGGNSNTVERQYNNWYVERKEEREGHRALSNLPFIILDRKMVIRNYEGAETFALAIFYEDYVLEEHEKGSKDRAGTVNGASMFRHKK